MKAFLKKIKIHLKTILRIFGVFIVVADTSSRVNVLRIFFRLLTPKTKRPTTLLPVSFQYAGVKKSILVHSVTDLAVLWEVFVAKEYDVVVKEPVKTIVDLGSNIGASVLFFLLRYPEAHIYAVEADPEIFERLQKNMEGEERITLIHAAIGAGDGEVTFYKNKSHLSGSTIKREHTKGEIRVSMISLEALLNQHGIQKVDILKFDIEGGEFVLFDSLPLSLLKKIHSLVGEIHEDIAQSKADSIIIKLSEYRIKKEKVGYNRYVVKCTRYDIY